jgi:hypothetical protein
MNAMTVLNSKAGMVSVVVMGALVLVAFVATKAEETISDTASAINPLNNNNIFASGVNGVGQKLSGNNNWSLGGWIYDITHDG